MRTFIRVNEKIRINEVRCVDKDGNQLGVMATREALNLARQQGLDLIEIAPNASPPVCKISDFGKYRYELSRKEREARKHQHGGGFKEVKFHANVEEHDYQTKLRHIREFIEKGLKIKASLFFRGRENIHQELGYRLMTRVIKDCEDIGMAETSPRIMGRSLIMLLSPRLGKHQVAPVQAAPKPAAASQPAAAQPAAAQPAVAPAPPPASVPKPSA